MTPVISFYIACYNEEENIASSLDTLAEAMRLTGVPWEGFIVDDGSVDRSVELVTDYLATHPGLPLRHIINESNKGVGINFVETATLATGTYYRSYWGDDIESVTGLTKIFQYLGKTDLILVYYDPPPVRSLHRTVLSLIYTALINFICGLKVRYYNGMPIFRRDHVLKWHSNYYGLAFQADMVTRVIQQGGSFFEVPVQGHDRKKGRSSALHLKNIFSVAHFLLDLIIRRIGSLLPLTR
jgi:dolichol-phosphate mannosyltransferase